MQLNAAVFLHALELCAPLARAQSTLPILSQCLFEPTDDAVRISATDLEGFLRVEIPQDTGGLGLPAERMAPFTLTADKIKSLVRSFPRDASITLTRHPSEAHSIRLTSGRTKAQMSSLPVDDFPVPDGDDPNARDVVLNGAEFKRALKAVSSSQAVQDVRYYLNGTHLNFTKTGLDIVATDGHRLARVTYPYDLLDEEEYGLNIPSARVANLLTLLDDGDITLRVTPNTLAVETGPIQFHTKLIDGRYPDYRRVIPTKYTDAVEFDREAMLQTARRVASLGGKKTGGILHINGNTLTLSLKDPDEGNNIEESLGCDCVDGNLDVRTGVSLPYLIDAIKAIETPSVHLRARDPDSALLIHPAPITDAPDTYVIMPMRL